MNNLKQFYEQDALREILESTRRIEELRYRMLISKVPKESKKVLDIGCGNGKLICMLAEKGYNPNLTNPKIFSFTRALFLI